MNCRYILCLLVGGLILLLGACHSSPSKMEKTVALERDALLHSPESTDSLLEKAKALVNDSVSLVIKDAIKARDLGAQEKYDLSMAYVRKVEDFCYRQQPDERIYNLLAYIENVKGVNLIYSSSSTSALQDSAIQALEKSIHYSRLTKDNRRLPLTYYNIYCIYSDRNQYAKAAEYSRKALFAADSLKYPISASFFLYESMGDLYVFMNDYEAAKATYDKVATLMKNLSSDDRTTLFSAYGNLYNHQGDYPRAIAYYGKALREVRKVTVAKDFRYYSALSEYAMSLVTAGQDLPKAKVYLDQALRYYISVKDSAEIFSIKTALLNLAVKQKDIGRISSAELVDFKKKLAAPHIDPDTRQKGYQALEAYYLQTKDYERAYNYNKIAMALRDSIYGYSQQQHVMDVTMRYRQDTTSLRHRIFVQKQESEIKSLHWKFIAGILVGAVAILAFVVYYVYTRRRKAVLYHKYIANINRLKMQNIRNCISPHFTFNVLNHEILLNSESKEKYNRLVGLAQLLRQSLDSTEEVTVPLSQELNFIDAYVHLLNECGKHFSYTLRVDEGIDMSKVIIPSMILQIPVENAVKHGFITDDPAHYIQVNIKKVEDGVDIEILNNGVSYSPFTRVDKEERTGIGMQVVFQSLLMMNRYNRHKITFTITDRKGEQLSGTRVVVHIPVAFDYSFFKNGQ